MCGLMDELKNAKNVVDQSKAILNALQYPLLKCTPIFLDVLKRKKQGDSGLEDDLGRILVPVFLSVAQCRQSQGDFWQHN
jgi:hypothetical protein